MKKHFLFLGFITILLLVLSSCSSRDENIRFEGEGEHWKALYHLTKGENTQNGQGNITYKGKDKENLGKVSFTFEGETEKLEGTDNASQGKINLNSNCSGCSTQSSKVPYHVTIKWNGKKESFDLNAK